MAIKTSRYGNKRLREPGCYPVGISIGAPKFKLGYDLREQCYTLAPKGTMLHLDYDPYKEAYFNKLDALGAQKVINIVRRLESRAAQEGKTLVLLCFEDIRKPGEWCHRTLFAEWWKNQTGEEIEELEDAEEPKIPAQKKEEKAEEASEQISIFEIDSSN